MKTWRAVGAVVILGAAALAAPPALGAVSPLVQVTGASPFAVGCAGGGHDPPGEVFGDAEGEAGGGGVPADPSHVAGSWQQDRWSDGGSHGLVASASLNGGTAWNGETF